MLRGNNDDDETDLLAALTSGARPGPRTYHWRQSGVAGRRCGPTSIDSALSRLETSKAAIQAYLTRLDQLKQWLNDRLKAIEMCLDRVRRVEKVVAGVKAAPPLPGDCPPHFLLVACYADLARQALHGPPDEHTSPECGWSSSNGDQSEGDVKTSLTPDSLFGPLHDAAMAAGFAVLAATDQRVPAAALQVEGYEAAAASITTDSLTAEQQRQYTSLMSIIPPLKKPERRLSQLLSSLTKSFYHLTRDTLMGDADNSTERRQQASGKVFDTAQLRSFSDFVTHSRPIVRMFSLPPGCKLLLANTDVAPPENTTSTHQAPSILMEQLVDVVLADVTRRFQTETYGANVVLSQLTRRLEKAPKVADGPVELVRELEMHSKMLEMSSRYDSMDALTLSLITCAVERIRTQTASIIDKWKSACPCRLTYHVVVQ